MVKAVKAMRMAVAMKTAAKSAARSMKAMKVGSRTAYLRREIFFWLLGLDVRWSAKVSSLELHCVPALDPPTREREFGGHFLKIRAHY